MQSYVMTLSSSVCIQNGFRAITYLLIYRSFWILNTIILDTEYRLMYIYVFGLLNWTLLVSKQEDLRCKHGFSVSCTWKYYFSSDFGGFFPINSVENPFQKNIWRYYVTIIVFNIQGAQKGKLNNCSVFPLNFNVLLYVFYF